MKRHAPGVTRWRCCALAFSAAIALVASAQQPSTANTAAVEEAVANPARPTVSTPATLTPVGYLQFETGFVAAWHSPEFSSQASFNEVAKVSVSRRIEFLAAFEPFAHTNLQPANAIGDVSLGVQGVVHHGEGAVPTIALSYFRRVYGGAAPDLDIGSARNTATLLASADVKGFHYDTNYLFSEVIDDRAIHRAQFGQTLSVSHPLGKKYGVSGEIWHFTQPFLRSHAVGNLWALNYTAKKNLVFDVGFNRGLTNTSTRWEVFGGFTYLLPKNLLRH
jgi:hypothetical protein